MIKKYSAMKHNAVDPVPAGGPDAGAGAPPAPPAGGAPDAAPSAPPAGGPPTPPAGGPPSAPSAPGASPSPDAMGGQGEDAEVSAAKLKIYLEQQCADLGFNIESIDIRKKNKAVSLLVSSEGGVISQKDMILLAAQLNTNDLSWELMEDALASKGGNWQINFAKVK